ncbi:uncharacterized protein LOC134530342 [Bacillus rossius redtenbacheri]|uniref:uncharacterized protein LOC134530342 n=1 Tax=Bacillus rossius redtenbacheri TaxID=93214 RepID=UPI002FDE8111
MKAHFASMGSLQGPTSATKPVMSRSASAKQISSMKFTTMTVSKWLCHSEASVFCNVMESGDIVEIEHDGHHTFGIGLRARKTDKKGPESIKIAYLKVEASKASGKVVKVPLLEFWVPEANIRINNRSDREYPYHPEEVIRQQVTHAIKTKNVTWQTSEQFAHWCRHNNKPATQDGARRQASDVSKWGSVAANMGVLMFLKKRERFNSK